MLELVEIIAPLKADEAVEAIEQAITELAEYIQRMTLRLKEGKSLLWARQMLDVASC